MKLERSKNTKRGIVFGSVNRVIMLILPFITQTVMIRTLGMEFTGIKGLYSSILTVLSLAELGIGSAIVYSMYKPIVEDDIDTICALYYFYKKVYRIIGTCVLFLGLVVTPFLRYLIKGTYPETINLYVVFLLYLLNSVLSYWLCAYKSSLLSAYQRNDVQSRVGSVINICLSVAQIFILVAIRNFYLYLVITIVFTIINNLVISKTVDRMFPEIQCRGTLDKTIIEDIKTKVTGLMIGRVCGATRNTFDNIFMSMFLGLTQAAIYANYYYVLTALSGFTGIILSSLLAGIGNSIAMESKEKNYGDMMKLNFLYMLISGWFTVCMLCLYQPFMTLWAGENNLFPEYVMILFPIYFYIARMGDVRGLYSDAAGLFWENRYRTLAEAIANIILNYVLVIKFGAFGIVLATILTLFFIGFLGATQVLFKHYFKNGMVKYLLYQFLFAGITALIAFITYKVCLNFTGEVIIVLVKRMLVCASVAPIMYLVVLGRTKIFQESFKWLIAVLKR